MNKKIIIGLAIYFVLFCFADRTVAQIEQTRFFRNTVLVAGFEMQMWNFDKMDDSFNQFAIPMAFYLPIGEKFSLDFISATAMNSFGELELNGFADTRVRGSLILGENVLCTAGLSLPTGKSQLTSEELNISSITANHALRTRVPNLGQGLDVNIGLVAAHDMDGWTIGGGIGYLKKGKYQPFDGSDLEYVPGDEFNITLGADFGDENKLTTDIIYTMYGSDKVGDEEVFKSGNRILIQARYLIKKRIATGKIMNLTFFLRERTKSKNEFAVAQGLQEEKENSNGNELEFGGIMLYPLSPTLRLKTLFDYKAFSDNGYDTGGASVFGIGGGFNVSLSSSVTTELGMKYSTGNVRVGTMEIGISGITIFGGFNVQL